MITQLRVTFNQSTVNYELSICNYTQHIACVNRILRIICNITLHVKNIKSTANYGYPICLGKGHYPETMENENSSQDIQQQSKQQCKNIPLMVDQPHGITTNAICE